MGRHILNGLTVLSLLVFLATGMLWASRGRSVPTLAYHSGRTCYEIALKWRGAEYCWIAEQGPTHWDFHSLPSGHHGGDFVFARVFNGMGYTIGLPYWFICLVTALAPTTRLTKRLRRKRPRRGLCSECGYDLRATPDRCPECGTVVDRAPKMRGSATEDTEHTEEENEKSPQMRH